MVWWFLFVLAFLTLNVFTNSSPIEKTSPALIMLDPSLPKLIMTKLDGPDEVTRASKIEPFTSEVTEIARPNNETIFTVDVREVSINRDSSFERNIRPGQRVRSYSVKISFDGDTFNGEAIIDLLVDSTNDPVLFHLESLEVHTIIMSDTAQSVEFNPGDGILEIFLNNAGTNHIVIVYSGKINNFGRGIFQGGFDD